MYNIQRFSCRYFLFVSLTGECFSYGAAGLFHGVSRFFFFFCFRKFCPLCYRHMVEMAARIIYQQLPVIFSKFSQLAFLALPPWQLKKHTHIHTFENTLAIKLILLGIMRFHKPKKWVHKQVWTLHTLGKDWVKGNNNFFSNLRHLVTTGRSTETILQRQSLLKSRHHLRISPLFFLLKLTNVAIQKSVAEQRKSPQTFLYQVLQGLMFHTLCYCYSLGEFCWFKSILDSHFDQ